MFGRKKRALQKEFMERPVGEGPVGVWAEYRSSGRYEDLPTIYEGRDDDGLDVYLVLLPIDARVEAPSSMGINLMPAHTAISIPLPRGGSEVRDNGSE